LDVPCSANLSTYDLETELFLHILQNCAESVQVWLQLNGMQSSLFGLQLQANLEVVPEVWKGMLLTGNLPSCTGPL
jgi:hypothetical protein